MTIVDTSGKSSSVCDVALVPYFPFGAKVNFEFTNWATHTFRFETYRYANVEQGFMHQKALLFGDAATAAAILKTEDPGECQKLGRQVQDFDSHVWRQHRFDIVYRLNYAKWSSTEGMRNMLVALNPQQCMVELGTPDFTNEIWGIGDCTKISDWNDVREWRGENLMGQILMKVRRELRRSDL